jgi:hypothetical protein
MRAELTKDYVCSLFDYKEGILYWKERPREHFKRDWIFKHWNKRYSGQRASSRSGKYAVVSINKIRYQEHSIVFLMHHGYLPKIIDHIDNNPQNNCIENLREASYSENLQNAKKPKSNTSGAKNVFWSKQKQKWYVRFYLNKKGKHFGFYDDFELAELVAYEAREKHFGKFARHN